MMDMSEQDFAHTARIYGASLARWPDALRTAATAFMHRHPQTARRLLQAERDVDAALALLPSQTPGMALEQRILRDFDQAMQKRKRRGRRLLGALANALATLSPKQTRFGPALGALMALLMIFGFAGGYAGYASALDKTSSKAILAAAFGASDTAIDIEDLSS